MPDVKNKLVSTASPRPFRRLHPILRLFISATTGIVWRGGILRAPTPGTLQLALQRHRIAVPATERSRVVPPLHPLPNARTRFDVQRSSGAGLFAIARTLLTLSAGLTNIVDLQALAFSFRQRFVVCNFGHNIGDVLTELVCNRVRSTS